jgi:RHS repeat-associated protein
MIQEYTASSLTSTKQFVWSRNRRCEARDSLSTITAQYFNRGEKLAGTNYYFTKDKLGSVRELYASGVQAQYGYDPFGQVTKIAETVPADFGFGGYYAHARSGLSLTRTRAYESTNGRWISRDPIEERGGMNLFAYVNNEPTQITDAAGLDCFPGKPVPGPNIPWGTGYQWGSNPSLEWGSTPDSSDPPDPEDPNNSGGPQKPDILGYEWCVARAVAAWAIACPAACVIVFKKNLPLMKECLLQCQLAFARALETCYRVYIEQ